MRAGADEAVGARRAYRGVRGAVAHAQDAAARDDCAEEVSSQARRTSRAGDTTTYDKDEPFSPRVDLAARVHLREDRAHYEVKRRKVAGDYIPDCQESTPQ